MSVEFDAGEGCLAALRAQLGDMVLAGAEIPARNLSDWSGASPSRPLAVIRPSDTAGVAAAVKIAHAHHISIVPQGGLTGLCGGARADERSIALSLERLTGIEEIDPSSATMIVRAGTPLEAVQRAADEAGFFCPLDLGARGSCAIGGNLSTNAGGNRVIRYGMARDMVLGLEVVLPDGTVVTSLNKMLKNNAGYDLKHLFIGSEGTLGIITRIVLRLFPKPACTMAAICGLADYAFVLKLLNAARGKLGPLLSAFEVMWPDYWDVATRKITGVRNPLSSEHGFYVLVEAQGSDESDRARFQGWLESLVESEIIEDGAVAQSLSDIAAFWGVRDASGEVGKFLGPHLSFDIGLPVGEMDRYAAACRAMLQTRLPGCVALFFGHIGDGNMHIVACVPGRTPQPKADIESIVYGLVREFGGTVSAEHGIGTLKKKWLAHARSEEEIHLMHIIKRAIDPSNLLNPGKVLCEFTNNKDDTQGGDAMTKFTRRETIGIGIGIGAAAALSPLGRSAFAAVPVANVPAPKFAIEEGAELRVLRPAKFVPADEEYFNSNTKKFTEATGINVKVDYQAWEDLRPQTAVTANTGAGPDVVLGWTDDPHLYSDKLVELTDVADYLGKKYGGWYDLSQLYGKKFGTDTWIAIPFGGTGAPAVYRKSWVGEAGFDKFPTDLDGFLKLCQGLKKLGHPAGFTLGHAVGDANSFCHWLVWTHGGFMIDESQKVTINSKETIAALKYGKALYETFAPGTQSWLDSNNNKAMLAGEISMTQNGVSLYNAFKKSEDPNVSKLADDVFHAPMPIGPVGRPTTTALVVNAMIFSHTEYPNAAKAYLTYMMEAEQYDTWLTASSGYWAQPLAAYAESAVWTSDPKITLYRDTMKNALWLAYKGPITEASAAVVADYVMVDMVSSVATGAATPEDAAAEAERRAKRYFKG